MMRALLISACLVPVLYSCTNQEKENNAKAVDVKPAERPVNIILMIGDGMGLAQVSAAMVADKEGLRAISSFKYVGLVKTSSSDDYITDSAAGATAYSAGEKTYNGAIGVGADKKPRKTILEMAEEHGLFTGLVATCSITHATPASFYAHQPDREMHEQIAADFYGKGIDFMAGTGKPYFNMDKLKQDGYQVITGYPLTAAAATGKTAWFYNDSIHPPKYSEGRGNFLPDATKTAIDKLSTQANGFFLMVEGSQIDWGGHNNDAAYTIAETVDFDHAIASALEFAKKDGRTLVIVTADHETGGLALTAGSLQQHKVESKYITEHHTGIMVPVYAYGPGAQEFTGIMENTDVFRKIKTLYGF